MRSGFTLVELIIYMAIMGLVVTALVSFNLSIGEARNKSEVIEEVNANVRDSLKIVKRLVQSASAINTSTSVFGSDPGSVSLAMNDASKNPTIISLTADDGIIQVKEGSADPLQIMSNDVSVTSFIFSDLTASSTRQHIRLIMSAEFEDDEDGFIHSTTVTSSMGTRY